MAKHEMSFKMDRETKGAVRYQEQHEDGRELIGQLYIRKSGLALYDMGSSPDVIRVTVEVPEDEG